MLKHRPGKIEERKFILANRSDFTVSYHATCECLWTDSANSFDEAIDRIKIHIATENSAHFNEVVDTLKDIAKPSKNGKYYWDKLAQHVLDNGYIRPDKASND